MEWKPLALEDKPLFDQSLRDDQLTLSDYTFTNLWIWNISREYHISVIDDFLCIRFNYEGKRTYLCPIGRGNKGGIIQKLIDEDPLFRMRAVPEITLPELQSLPLEIQEETEHFDYIYSFQDLLYLKGTKFNDKRNVIHQFERNYLYEYKQIVPELIPKVIEAEITWYNEYQEPPPGLHFEHKGILNALEDFSTLNVYGGALVVENRVVAYSLVEYMSENMLVVHLEKSLKNFKGGYAMINNQILKHLNQVSFLNHEEDLGLHNLSIAKKSYHPVRFEKKFLITLKNNDLVGF